MIFGVVDSMAGPLDRHATMLAQPRLRLPTAGGTFPPRPKGGASKFVSSVNVNLRPYKNKKTKGKLISIILMNQDLPLILLSPTLGKNLVLRSKFLHESVDASMS